MRDDFAVLILSHGRPDGVSQTITALTNARYSGAWYIVLDSEDETAAQYAARWGTDRILTFDKDEVAETFDLADNGGSRAVIVYARNAAEGLAAGLGLRYYLQLDDDYTYFAHRYQRGASLTYAYQYHLDRTIDAMIEFLDASGAVTVAMAQGGDFMGGLSEAYATPLRRKAMNTFFCRVGRPVRFVGRLNEDVSTYVWRGSQGALFFTVTQLAINQANTQSQGGGMTSAYLDTGTYRKSFYTVMRSPSCVKISSLGRSSRRLHHQIMWNHAVPKIISDRHQTPR